MISEYNYYGPTDQIPSIKFNWIDTDTFERFKYNQSKAESNLLLKKYGWNNTENHFEYTFNKYRFRCQEFEYNEKDSILFLGCSHTMGVGIPYEYTYPYYISRKLNLKNYNLGIGGGSSNTCFRFGSYWISKLKPKIVIVMKPNKYRIELFSENKWTNSSILTKFPPRLSFLKYWYKLWATNEENIYLHELKNYTALKHIALENKCKYLEYSADEYFPTSEITKENTNTKILANNYIDLARDLLHFGKNHNASVAIKILKTLDFN